MLNPNCTIDFDKVDFVKCDKTRHFYFSKTQVIRLERGYIIATLNFDLRNQFLGIGKGDYLNTITLLPSEELKVEIIRRSKYTRELHEQTSIEREIEETFTETVRDTFRTTGDFKFTVKAEGGVNILAAKAKASVESSLQLKIFYERFKEVIEQTRTKVSSKYDFSIDITSEQENTFKSIRTIKNPNDAHPVHYMVSQMMKKYKTELVLVDVEFDYHEKLPSDLFERKNLLQIMKPIRMPFNFFLQKIKKATINPELPSNIESIELPKVPFMKYKKNELLALIKENPLRDYIEKEIVKLEKLEQFKPGVKDTREYCVRTSDIYVEAKLSKCSVACTDDCA